MSELWIELLLFYWHQMVNVLALRNLPTTSQETRLWSRSELPVFTASTPVITSNNSLPWIRKLLLHLYRRRGKYRQKLYPRKSRYSSPDRSRVYQQILKVGSFTFPCTAYESQTDPNLASRWWPTAHTRRNQDYTCVSRQTDKDSEWSTSDAESSSWWGKAEVGGFQTE